MSETRFFYSEKTLTIVLGELRIQVVGDGVAQPHGTVVAVHLADLRSVGEYN